MTERTITTNVIKHVRGAIRHAVVLKHADRFTAGIPDFSVSVMGGTTWIEMKYQRAGARLIDIIDTVQLHLCYQLATVTNGRCWIVVYEELQTPPLGSGAKAKQVTVWTPRALFAQLYPKFDHGLEAPDAFKGVRVEPLQLRGMDDKLSYAGALFSHGAIRVPGWPYGLVTKLVQEAVNR